MSANVLTALGCASGCAVAGASTAAAGFASPGPAGAFGETGAAAETADAVLSAVVGAGRWARLEEDEQHP
jgi:hypothetical protein